MTSTVDSSVPNPMLSEAKRALESASSAVKVLKTILSKQRLNGSIVADEIDNDIWVSIRAIDIVIKAQRKTP